MAFYRRPTNPARPYPELHTRKATVFSITGVVEPALHLWLLLLRAWDIKVNPGHTCSGCNKSIRCDATPIVCLICQQHFRRTCSHLTWSQNGIRGFVCLFCSGGAAALHSTANVTSSSVLPCRCLLCHAKISRGIRPIMCRQCPYLAHRKCCGISSCVANPSWLCSTCSLPTTSIPTQPMMAMTNNTHALNSFLPITKANSPFPITFSSTPSLTIAHAPATSVNPVPFT